MVKPRTPFSGWIPTNYCERHAPALMHDLLKTLSCFLSVCDNEFTAETLADFGQKIKTTATEIRLVLVSIILIIKVFSTHLPIRGQCTLSYTRISTCSDSLLNDSRRNLLMAVWNLAPKGCSAMIYFPVEKSKQITPSSLPKLT